MEPTDLPPPESRAAAASNDTAFDTGTVVRKSWQQTTAPQFIALFLWVVFFDQLAVKTLALGGLGPSSVGAAVGGGLCFLLLYYVPAMWGFRSGQPLTVVSASTFGRAGAARLTGSLFGLAQVVWLSVATYYATWLVLEGLAACHLIDPRAIRPVPVGGYLIPSPLFLLTSALWCCWAALVGAYLVRVIAALMRVFPVFPAALLGVAMLMTIKGLPGFRPLGIDLSDGSRGSAPALMAGLNMIQLVFGFFATAGLASVEWGAASRSANDVRMGGLVGVAFAPWIIATLVLLTVAGAQGGLALETGRSPTAVGAGAFTFHEVVAGQIGGRLACTILLVFGLASLAPTTYAAFVIGQRWAAARPWLSRVQWSMVGAGLGWLLILTGLPGKLETIFHVMGAIFAPMAGAMGADYLRQKGRWGGPRPGVNQAGLVAWAVGLTIGLLPLFARAWGRPELARVQPAAVFAYLAAFLVYLVLANLGAEPKAEGAGEPHP